MGIRSISEVISEIEKEPPIPCDFRLNQKVMFTNDNGCVFGPYTIIGFEKEPCKRFIYLDYECYWFPTSVNNIKEIWHAWIGTVSSVFWFFLFDRVGWSHLGTFGDHHLFGLGLHLA